MTSRPLPEGAGHPRELVLTRPALPTEPRAIRTLLRDWLARWSWRDDDLDDIVAAVDEAVANVVDHAYRLEPAPGAIHLRAAVTTEARRRRAIVRVSDDGRWRPVPDDPGFRGHGLRMMDACTATMDIDRTDRGTTVTLISEPVTAS
jgi:anti-sigma regulatory factor (Ser/Thr protein kinase)